MPATSLLVGLATEDKQDDIVTALGLLSTDAKLEAVRALLAGTLSTVPAELPASGKSYVAENLVDNTVSTSFQPIAGRPFYLTITGSGSGPLKVVYSRDAGATWLPEILAVDAGAPIVSNSLTYAAVAGVLVLQVSERGVLAAVLPGDITGTITVDFSQ